MEKTLPKLIKNLKNKRLVIYGVGSFFQCIKKYYDISGLKIAGIADNKNFISGSDNLELLIAKYYDYADIQISGITDKKKENSDFSEEEYNSVSISSLDDIKDANIDYIIISLKNYAEVAETLHERFKDTQIKIRPLAKKSLWLLYKEL